MMISRSILAMGAGLIAMFMTCGYMRFLADFVSEIVGAVAAYLLGPVLLYILLLFCVFRAIGSLSFRELLGAWPGIVVGIVLAYLPYIVFVFLYQTGYWKI